MAKHKPNYSNYILLVDNYRRPSRQRNTCGRYRVGAKTPGQAIQLLRAKIGFGSILVYYEDNDKIVGYKECKKEVFENQALSRFRLEEVRHANDPYSQTMER